jgi:hypothetical protein
MDFLAFFTTIFFAVIFTSPPFPLLAELLKARIAAKHVASAALFFTTHQTRTTDVTILVGGDLPDAAPD